MFIFKSNNLISNISINQIIFNSDEESEGEDYEGAAENESEEDLDEEEDEEGEEEEGGKSVKNLETHELYNCVNNKSLFCCFFLESPARGTKRKMDDWSKT